MSYEVFVSYSRKDNNTFKVSNFIKKLSKHYLNYSGEKLKLFFDTSEIRSMDDWRHKIFQGLKESRIFLLILSPNYLDSSYCDWEITEFLKYENSRFFENSIVQIYSSEITDLNEMSLLDSHPWLKIINRRQRLDFREWYASDINSFKSHRIVLSLNDLCKDIYNNLLRHSRANSSPGNLPAPNKKFIGRNLEIHKIHESTMFDKLGSMTVIQGIGGIGKTSLAIQYAYAYADFYSGGRWILPSEGKSNLASLFRNFIPILGINLEDDEKNDDKLAFKKILMKLELISLKGKSRVNLKDKSYSPALLLILDNVDSSELIQPPQTDVISGLDWLKILVTTRLSVEEIENCKEDRTILRLDELSSRDSLNLIENYQLNSNYLNSFQLKKAEEIVILLGGFTLAIELTAIYLRECNGRVTCADFLQLLKKKGGLVGIDLIATKTKTFLSHEKLISLTLTPTLEQLSILELKTLAYASQLPNENIPVSWLRELLKNDFHELRKDSEAGLDDPWLQVINRLLNLRLLRLMESKDLIPHIVSIHKLVKELVEFKLSKIIIELIPTLIQYIKKKATLFEQNWQKSYSEEMDILKQLCLIWIKKGIDILYVANQVANTIRILGYTKEAKNILREITIVLPKYSSHKHELFLKTYTNLGLVEKDLGNLFAAKMVFSKIIRQCLIKKTLNNSILAKNYSYLGLILYQLGQLKNAKKLYTKGLEIQKEYSYSDPVEIAKFYSYLGTIELDMGYYQRAKILFTKSIKIGEKHYPSNHVNLALRKSCLGIVEMNLGNFLKAKLLLEEAINIYKTKFNEDNPEVAIKYADLGMIEKEIGNLQKGVELVEKSILFLRKNYSSNHPYLSSSYALLGIMKFKQDNIQYARKLIRSAIKIDLKFYNSEHPSLSISYMYLGLVEQKLKNYEKSKELFNDSIGIIKKNYRANHPNIALNYLHLCSLEYETRNLKLAIRYLFKAYKIGNQNYKKNHPFFKLLKTESKALNKELKIKIIFN